jgi:hypothetical protein
MENMSDSCHGHWSLVSSVAMMICPMHRNINLANICLKVISSDCVLKHPLRTGFTTIYETSSHFHSVSGTRDSGVQLMVTGSATFATLTMPDELGLSFRLASIAPATHLATMHPAHAVSCQA